jgi:hypothetical protein
MHRTPQQRVGGMFVCEERLLRSHHTQVPPSLKKKKKKREGETENFSNFPVQMVL